MWKEVIKAWTDTVFCLHERTGEDHKKTETVSSSRGRNTIRPPSKYKVGALSLELSRPCVVMTDDVQGFVRAVGGNF